MEKPPYTGNAKVGRYLLERFDQRLMDRYVSTIPSWLQTYHLTLLTLLWSGLVLLFSWLARSDIRWLWGHSAAVIAQYLTDSFDGAVGRYRRTGLVWWGYYMDHLLDFVFLCALGLGYAWLAPEAYRIHVLLVMCCFGTIMVSAFLAFSVTNKFPFAYFGMSPTELHLALVAVNTLMICAGGFPQRVETATLLVLILAALLVALMLIVYRTQRQLWALDMASRHNHLPSP